jgi:hypothetical protein
MNEPTLKETKKQGQMVAGIDFKAAYEVLFKAYIRTYRKEVRERSEKKGETTNG